jgi:hypothetical protein
MSENPPQIVQIAPWPDEWVDLIATFRYKPGWSFKFVPDLGRDFEPDDHRHERPPIGRGATLVITSLTYNSYSEYAANAIPDYRVNHYKIIPAATFNRNAWKRWILDQCIEVEIHEACEFARFIGVDGDERPFAPLHGPGENPYTIHEFSTEEQRRTSFRGEMT